MGIVFTIYLILPKVIWKFVGRENLQDQVTKHLIESMTMYGLNHLGTIIEKLEKKYLP